jgi:excisionase family DNA binding protein
MNAFHRHDLHCEVCQQYYSIRHVAERFDLSQKTIRRMIAAGKIKAKRINGAVRIAHSELMKAVREV